MADWLQDCVRAWTDLWHGCDAVRCGVKRRFLLLPFLLFFSVLFLVEGEFDDELTDPEDAEAMDCFALLLVG